MSSDDDSQLKDLLSQTLENKGVLPKLRAELRANVFLALEGNEKFNDKLKSNSILQNLMLSPDGMLTLYIVKEFLEFCKLDYTNSVFEPEVRISNQDVKYAGRQKVISDLNLGYVKDDVQLPVLSQLIKLCRSNCAQSSSKSIADQEQNFISIKSNKKLVNGNTDESSPDRERLKENVSASQGLAHTINTNDIQKDTSTTSNKMASPLPPLSLISKLKSPISIIKTINDLDANEIKTPGVEVKDEEKSGSPSDKLKGDTGSVTEIEEDLESADDLLNSSGSFRDDITQDNSISNLSTGIGDYMENVKVQR